jgi:hypothetical protein
MTSKIAEAKLAVHGSTNREVHEEEEKRVEREEDNPNTLFYHFYWRSILIMKTNTLSHEHWRWAGRRSKKGG